MKKIFLSIALLIILLPCDVLAKQGCCSWHGGESGSCSSSGKEICNDGTTSPTCTCTSTYTTPTYIYGCTDSTAKNYNSSANRNDGSCVYNNYGCTDSTAINYNSQSNTDNGSCKYQKNLKQTVTINYKIKYVYKKNKKYTNGTIIVKGENGKKEITYLVTTDASGKIISKKKQSTVTIKKVVNEVIYKNKK